MRVVASRRQKLFCFLPNAKSKGATAVRERITNAPQIAFAGCSVEFAL